jgi:hypothetical protein
MAVCLGCRLLSLHNCQLGNIRSEPSGVARAFAFEAVIEPMETCSLWLPNTQNASRIISFLLKECPLQMERVYEWLLSLAPTFWGFLPRTHRLLDIR